MHILSMARYAIFTAFLSIFAATNVHCRILTYKPGESSLISDGVANRVDNQTIFQSLNHENLFKDACVHVYGFLPCADNIGGYIFQVIVLECLLLAGDYLLSRASTKLFDIFGIGLFGGIIFRLLLMIPRIVLILASGLSASHEAAQSMVVSSVGLTAGYTVFSLTLQWGACVIFGRTDISNEESNPQENNDATERSRSRHSSCEILLNSLTDSGVKVDPKTKRGAGIMLLSLLPFIMVQLSGIFDSPSWSRGVVLVTLSISVLGLLSYFTYQFVDPSDQRRSLEYSRFEHLLAHFLDHIANSAQDKLVTPDGDPNIPVITRVFTTIDKDMDEYITKSELEKLLSEIKSKKLPVDKDYALEEFLKAFDPDHDGKITKDEFIKGMDSWINEAKRLAENGESSSNGSLRKLREVAEKWIEVRRKGIDHVPRLMSAVLKYMQGLSRESLLGNRKLNTENAERIFEKFDKNNDGKLQVGEIKSVIMEVKFENTKHSIDEAAKKLMDEFDKDHDDMIDKQEFLEGIKKWIDEACRVAPNCKDSELIDEYHRRVWEKAEVLMTNKKQNESLINKLISVVAMKASFQVIIGALIVIFLGKPLTKNIWQLSKSIGIPSFFISFVVIPLAINIRQTLSSRFPARQKMERTASLTFSEIYGGVVMNNILSLSTILAIVYARGLTWDYSAEVLIVLVVGLIIGLFALLRSTYPFWSCIAAFFLYPLSLSFVYAFLYVLEWN